jgi:hypothetical protein
MMGRRKKEENHFPPNNNSEQEPEGNEENTYTDLDSKKTKTNYAKEHNEAHNILKEEILQVINEIL